MLYCQKCEITPILHCKIKLCFCNFFQLLMGSMYQNHNIYHQTGYIQHVKWVLSRIIAIWKLAHFLGVIFEFPPSTYLNNPMVVTSVVTYTFSIDSFVVSPWSRYGPSVDWGVWRVSRAVFISDCLPATAWMAMTRCPRRGDTRPRWPRRLRRGPRPWWSPAQAPPSPCPPPPRSRTACTGH